VTCFSEIPDNLLMWSHYGGRYKGFCLEFDTTTEALSKVKQVRYSATIPTLRSVDMFVRRSTDWIEEYFCTKSLSWSYEKEWRAFHKESGKEFGYPPEALTGVYFGPEIDPAAREIICLILGGQNETVQLYKGSRNPYGYQVLFEPVGYTSYLEAKKKGLL
jgi:hypothetical protein